jgi:hypothetical protein
VRDRHLRMIRIMRQTLRKTRMRRFLHPKPRHTFTVFRTPAHHHAGIKTVRVKAASRLSGGLRPQTRCAGSWGCRTCRISPRCKRQLPGRALPCCILPSGGLCRCPVRVPSLQEWMPRGLGCAIMPRRTAPGGPISGTNMRRYQYALI